MIGYGTGMANLEVFSSYIQISRATSPNTPEINDSCAHVPNFSSLSYPLWLSLLCGACEIHSRQTLSNSPGLELFESSKLKIWSYTGNATDFGYERLASEKAKVLR